MTWSYLSAIRISSSQTHVAAGGIVEGTVRLDIRALGEERVGEVGDFPFLGHFMVPFGFAFQLSNGIPPSFNFNDEGNSVRISYIVEAVPDHSGIRSGRVESPVTVVPNDPDGAQAELQLAQGWAGPWTTKTIAEQFRRVHGLLTYPSLPAFPASSSIPFTLHVVTISSTMSRNDGGTIWPSPPSHPREILAELQQRVYIRVGPESRVFTSPVKSLWGTVDVGPLDKEWIPAEGDASTGQWKQEMTFKSSFAPSSAPTLAFSRAGAGEVCVEYSLRINVHFGSHYSLTQNIPVVICPGSVRNSVDETTTATMEATQQRHRLDQGLVSLRSGGATDNDSTSPLCRVITAPETRPPRPIPANRESSGLVGRLQQHEIPMSELVAPGALSETITPSNATLRGHGYSRSLDLLDNSIALMENSLRPYGTTRGFVPLRPTRSVSPARGPPVSRSGRIRNFGAADVPENMYAADHSAVFSASRRPARRHPPPAFETNRPSDTESVDLPSYGASLDDEPPPYEE
ncbi:uncharacterized protein B0H18DRAFT_1039307 [Fomitopsis serialis]|uniref:uncharacterized protein n=1 Tax=Fomitopsis serialis TaxID=139415 RepID=UPI002007505F|nr:uncharacterized protein B0H18DRAFT_1039307 [Neoantrodia serialis]KAH9916026.1 hypothetical protein B0H18DRAFT_1039307 [Neoantrodia serialis]